MKKLILALLLVVNLTACVVPFPTIDNVNSVNIGDTYQIMMDKMGGIPYRMKCLQTQHGEICTATYDLGAADYVFFRFAFGNTVTSIYH